LALAALRVALALLVFFLPLLLLAAVMVGKAQRVVTAAVAAVVGRSVALAAQEILRQHHRHKETMAVSVRSTAQI